MYFVLLREEEEEFFDDCFQTLNWSPFSYGKEKKRKRNKKEGVVLGIPVRAAPTTLEDETNI
jgi:hypothetical protein